MDATLRLQKGQGDCYHCRKAAGIQKLLSIETWRKCSTAFFVVETLPYYFFLSVICLTLVLYLKDIKKELKKKKKNMIQVSQAVKKEG